MKCGNALVKRVAGSCIVVFTLFIAATGIAQNKPKEPGSTALTVGQVSWMKVGEGGPSPVADGLFAAKGEQVVMVLENVGKFKEVKGKHWYDIDVFVETPEGHRVFSREKYLGETGKSKLPKGVLEHYNVAINPGPIGMTPGKYVFKVTVHDRNAGQETSVSREFTLR